MKRKISVILLGLGLLLSACNVAEDSPSHSSWENSESTGQKEKKEPTGTIASEEDSVWEEANRKTEAWETWGTALQDWGGRQAICIRSVKAAAEYSGAAPIPTGDAVPIGEAGPNDPVFLFLFRNLDTTVRVYEVGDGSRGPFYEGRDSQPCVQGDLVFEEAVPGGLLKLRIPCYSQRDEDGFTQYGYGYRVVASWNGTDSVYYPVSPGFRHNDTSSNFLELDDDSEPIDYDQLWADQYEASRDDSEFSPVTELGSPDFTLTKIGEAGQGWGGFSKEEIVKMAVEHLVGIDTQDGVYLSREEYWTLSLYRGAGNVDYLEARYHHEYETPWQVILAFDPDTPEITLIAGINYTRDHFWGERVDCYALPGSDEYLMYNGAHYFLATLPSQPLQGGTIGYGIPIYWLSVEAINPNNNSQKILFGAITPNTDALFFINATGDMEYLAFLIDEGRVSHWLRTSYITGNPGLHFTNWMLFTVAIPYDDPSYYPTQPMNSAFDVGGSRVSVSYPNTCVTLTYDFERFQIYHQLDYTEQIIRQTASLQSVSTSGRYQLWRVNQRGVFESSFYCQGLYDTETGVFSDFGRLGSDYTVSFSGDHQLTLIEFEEDLSVDWNDYDNDRDWRKAALRQVLTIYSLPEMSSQILPMDLGDLHWAHTLWSHLWDQEEGLHYLLSEAEEITGEDSTIVILNPGEKADFGSFYLSVYREDGTYLGSYCTGIQPFWMKFSRADQPEMWQVDENQFLIFNPHREGEVYLFDLESGMSQKISLPLGPRVIRWLAAKHASYYESYESWNASRSLESWRDNPQILVYYQLLLEELQKNNLIQGRGESTVWMEDKMWFASNGLWYLKPEEGGSEVLELLSLSSYFSNYCLWETGGAEDVIVCLSDRSYSRREERSFGLLLWNKEAGLFHSVGAEEVYTVLPSHLKLDNGTFSLDNRRFGRDLRVVAGSNQILTMYCSNDEEQETAFLQIRYDDGYFQALWPLK